ncbi:MAG: hypothetical protein IT379_12635 [Deltaproteobacteria bacterium]|nr:hypothetical protein [Deltaproteobacteria bacterium]
MQPRLLATCCVTLMLSGCGCPDRVARMRHTLDAVSGHRIGTPTPAVALARAAHGRVPLEASSFVVIGRGEVAHLDGRPFRLERVADMRSDLDVVKRNWGILHPRRPTPDPWPVYVWLDAASSVAAARPWLKALAPGHELRVVVEPPSPAPSRPPAAARELYPEIAGARAPLRRGELIAGEWSGAIRGCQALVTEFAGVSSTSPGERWPRLRRGVPAAVERCGCSGVDPDRVEALLVLSHVSDGPDIRWLPLVLSPSGSPLDLPPSAMVRDLVRALDHRETEPAGRPSH